VVTGVAVVTSLTGELGNRAWLIAMILLAGAVLTMAAGLTLGVVRITGAHHHKASS
jgi:hypothetical protein